MQKEPNHLKSVPKILKSALVSLLSLVSLLNLANIAQTEVPILANKELSSLGLSSEQKLKLKKLENLSQAKLKTLVKEHNRKKEELKLLLTKNDANQNLVNQLRAEIKALQSNISQERIQNWLKIKALLTQEQEAKLREFNFQH